MSLRIWLSPPVEVTPGAWQAHANQYCTGGFVNYFPSKLDGTPGSVVVLTVGRAADWTAASADPQMELVVTVPATIDTVPALIDRLRTATVGDLTVAQRNSMQAVFDNHAIPRGDFVLATPLSKVFRRLVGWVMEQDEAFGLGISF